MYSLGHKVFPVDTHCFRVLNRLGLIHCEPPVRRHEDEIQGMIPENLRYSLHVTMVSLGREICLPQKPRCPDCPIFTFCDWGQRAQYLA